VIALALAALLAADAGAPPSSAVFLSSVEVEKRTPQPWTDGGGFRLVLQRSSSRGATSELLRRKVGRPVGEHDIALEVSPRYPASPDRPSASHRRPSFVIDHDEPAVRELLAAGRAALGPAPTVDRLTAYVHERLRQNMARGFDVASVVARRREGDCTEHAVLLAALLRATGRPARVVYGLALVPQPPGLLAEGHAWVEHFERGQWRPADAALLGIDVPIVYLPLDVLTDEGPGFALATTTMTLPQVRKVIVDASPSPRAKRGGRSGGGSPDAIPSPRAKRGGRSGGGSPDP
jgi:hypothetical protein